MNRTVGKSKIVNIFPICSNGVITHIGYCAHECEGDAEFKYNFLEANMKKDFKKCSKVQVKSRLIKSPFLKKDLGITLEHYKFCLQIPNYNGLFDEIFERIDAPFDQHTICLISLYNV
ncbi:hypothetical protein ACRASX_08845 [Flavobacterium sp. TMP13]|uniref:hypothetical protein n=1 Tax=Flavobacterium sp. TMP13 TaxID=3425950 RepID=UPI003D76E3E7